MVRIGAALALLVGCAFHPGATTGTASRGDAADGPGSDGPPADAAIDAVMIGIDFLPPAEEVFGSTNWTVGTDTAIDTTLLTVLPAPPAGVTLLAGTQDTGGSIAILRVGDFTVSSLKTLRVTGTRPLAILSDHDVTITGTIDLGARGALPGPGGADPALGPGAGGIGIHDDGSGSTYDDAGGGGASFGTSGARGGTVGAFVGGAPGGTYTLNGLVGGSGGGLAGVCSNPPGAGGGALLIYADHRFRITGAINAGGGGGAGGVMACATGSGSGAGGGSGGVIWLQTPDLAGTGVLAANGGGGGGGSYVSISDGGPGQDGRASATAAATGGTKANTVEASVGGAGAVQGTPAPPVTAIATGNAGGGGGGLGRIVFHAPSLGTILSSPTAVVP